MPFTFSHPAIILPVKKIAGPTLSLTGLVIGSITPDFEYFIRMKVKSIYSHSIPGLFWFDIPLGILLTFVYHNIVRDKLITNFPYSLYNRLNHFIGFNWNGFFKKHWAIVILSIAIGAVSHLFCDAFTHPQGFFVHRIGLLNRPSRIFGYRVPRYQILQQLSSAIGAIIIIRVIYKMPVSVISRQGSNGKYWMGVSITMLITLAARFIKGVSLQLYGDIIMTAITGLLLGLIVVPLFSIPKPPKSTSTRSV